MTLATGRTDRSEWRLIDELYPSLRRFAAVTAPSDLDPDDLLQEALVRVLRRRSLSDLEVPAAYLRRTMLNIATSHNRRMGVRRSALRLALSGESSSTKPSYPSDISELEALAPKERAALYLAEVEGYRFEEIAEMLGCTAAAARQRASRGRRRLRLALATEERS